MTDERLPFARAALTYQGKGWDVIPLPPEAKAPPPTGRTGYEADRASVPDIYAWIEQDHFLAGQSPIRCGNIGLHLPEIIIGIDVDAYGEKQGAATLAAAEAELGPLPRTYVSTARGDGISGIRLYKVRRAGRVWADTLGPDIEIIHHGHRYMVVAPSINPKTGTAYVWLAPDNSQCPAPHPEVIPYLPSIWEERLDRGSVDDRASKIGGVDASAALGELAKYPDGPMCPVLEGEVVRARTELAAAASRHDTCRGIVASIVRAGERGHAGSREALVEVADIFTSALQFGERRLPDPGEYDRMVTGAVQIVTADPTLPGDIGCCGSGSGTTSGGINFTPGENDEFWESRLHLSHIRSYARAQMAAPWSSLGAVLAQVVCRIPPRIVLPDIVGGYGSLNTFIGLVGHSGIGKGASERVAASCIAWPSKVEHGSIGSGEGLGHLYARNEKGEVVIFRESVLFSVPEIDTYTALGSRQGATLSSQLRSAWSGEQLGFGYADKNKALKIEEHRYRMGLVMGIQPGKAAGLFGDEAAGGFTQRMLLLPTNDPLMNPDEVPKPVALPWRMIDQIPPGGYDRLFPMDVDSSIRREIRVDRASRGRAGIADLNSHGMQVRLRVAAALALLDGRLGVTEEDWQLSGVIWGEHLATRNGIEEHLKSEAMAQNVARGKAEGRKEIAKNTTIAEDQVSRISTGIVRRMKKDFLNSPATLGQVRQLVAYRDRDHADEAIEALVLAGRLHKEGVDEGVNFVLVEEGL